jgi:DNA-binding SARP family transcriptional activator
MTMERAHLQGVPDPVAGLRVCLLGTFRLTADDRPVELPRSVQRVVAFVALQSQPVRRSYLGETLWPEVGDERSHGNLRSALWRLRRVDRAILEESDGSVRLGSEVGVDLHEATDLARRLVRPSATPPGLEGVIPLLGADLLRDWTEEWLRFERERFRELRLHALERWCASLTTQGRFAEAVEAGLLAVAAEPLRETSHRALIRAHLAEGNRGQALRRFESLRELMVSELGVEPTIRLEELAAEVAGV